MIRDRQAITRREVMKYGSLEGCGVGVLIDVLCAQ